uniref:Secreted protein n=1 Tax=Oncorhynchus tshawytscha TaxID=74940 RepID=A0AAZ3SB50_ONCTS
MTPRVWGRVSRPRVWGRVSRPRVWRCVSRSCVWGRVSRPRVWGSQSFQTTCMGSCFQTTCMGVGAALTTCPGEQWVNCLAQGQNNRFLPSQLGNQSSNLLGYWPNALTTRLPS